MGCTQSVSQGGDVKGRPHSAGGDGPEKQGGSQDTAASTTIAAVHPDGDNQRGQGGAKSGTRARRLSFIPAEHSILSHPVPPEAPPQPDAPQGPPAAAKGPRGTRARRLSHVAVNQEQGAVPPDGLAGEDSMDEMDLVRGEQSTSAQLAGSSTVDFGGAHVVTDVAALSRAGKEPGFEKTNQDNCCLYKNYLQEDQALYAAFDGHGPNGHQVSGFLAKQLPIALANELRAGADVPVVLKTTFHKVNEALRASQINCDYSGSTAVLGLLQGNQLITAWVGDSRAVAGREQSGKLMAVDLTVDHKPFQMEESARIVATGGRVERLQDEMGQEVGPYRVWLKYAWVPGLAMSRAFGDNLAASVGVISTPDVKVVELTPADRFVLLCSDGVWEFISSLEAVEIVARASSAEAACRTLVDEAQRRWLMEEDGVVDDITAVVVMIASVIPGESA